ncbi:porin family protein [Polaribacter septentrionalilitoris]|uniref:hypothetical protein n=1 Tax=Polaribacter septentrionalilitoris TaxID=2494657 RepID=UPI00135C9DC7|nr:hypothetical protein [Polaribacter septentrionalilitoris]
MRKQGIILGLLLACFQFASAQFTLEGEFRPRTELFGNGQSKTALAGSTPWLQTSVRAAINASYKTETYTVYLGFQEVFLFGDRPQISPSGNGNFRVQEAWANIKLAETWSLKLGRQPLSYDDQRILGGLAWAQQARTHDVGVLKHKSKGGFGLDVGYSLNTFGDNIYDTAALFSYRELFFAHANKKLGKLNLSALYLNTVYQNGTDLKSRLYTLGVHAKYNIGAFGLASNIFFQNGDRVGGVAVKGANLLSLDATFKATEKTTLLAGLESISGKTATSAAFFPLYGTNHKFNGLMDRFYVGNHGNAGGLIDLNIGAKFKLPKGYSLTAKFHNFKEQSLTKESLGNELDLVVAKGFKGFKLVAGYSQFFEPSSVTGADSTQNWAWAMLIIKPKFLSGK